jgi:hypothetical protein
MPVELKLNGNLIGTHGAFLEPPGASHGAHGGVVEQRPGARRTGDGVGDPAILIDRQSHDDRAFLPVDDCFRRIFRRRLRPFAFSERELDNRRSGRDEARSGNDMNRRVDRLGEGDGRTGRGHRGQLRWCGNFRGRWFCLCSRTLADRLHIQKHCVDWRRGGRQRRRAAGPE